MARLREAGCVRAEDEAAMLIDAAHDEGDLARLVSRRVAGEPLEQVLGRAQFLGRWYAVAPHVFVPRARTELLVEVVAAHIARGSVVVDMCTGVGAIVGALVDRCVGLGVEWHAAELDPVAAGCASRNLADRGVSVHVGDLDAALPGRLRGRVDVMVANAPYVPTGAIAALPREFRDHEARATLDGGIDGADVHRRLAVIAREWLAPAGLLSVETSLSQAQLVEGILAGSGLAPVTAHDQDGTAVVTGSRNRL